MSYKIILFIAHRVALYYHRKGFHVFYGIHNPDSKNKQRGYHIHFCIQYYNWNYYQNNLDDAFFYVLLNKLHNDFIKVFPSITVKMEVNNHV